MDQSEQNSFSVEKPSQTSSGPYTSPPPIGYPTREAMIGDPPAVAVETKSRGAPNVGGLESVVKTGGTIESCLSAICCCLACCGDDTGAA